MAQEKQLTKGDVQELLGQQTKVILDAVDKKIDQKIDEKIDSLAVMMNNAFQANQDYMDKNFQAIDKNFQAVKEQITKININAADAVRQDDFNKLEGRVAAVEEAVN